MIGRYTSFSQSARVNKVRFTKPSIDKGNSSIAVPLKSSVFRPSTFPRFFGKYSNVEHQERSRDSSDFKLQMVLGRRQRFLQLLRVNEVRPIKPPTDEGSFIIAMLSKKSFYKHFMFPTNCGSFLRLEQPERLRVTREPTSNVLGRCLSVLQDCRLRRTSFLRIPMDGWSSHKFVQYSRTNFSRFGTPVKSGVIIRSKESVKSMNFNLSKFC